MPDTALSELLEAFTEESAAALSREQATGAEVPFELVEADGRRGSPPLYCYRPLTGQFIQHRMGLLSGLASYAPAARALAAQERLEAYLDRCGVAHIPAQPRERADAALLAFLGRVFRDRSEFRFEPDRFQSAVQHLEQALMEGRAMATVIVPVLGLALEERTWQHELGEGLALVRGDRVEGAPPEAVWDEADRPRLMASYTSSQERIDPLPLGSALRRFQTLLSALRLFERGDYRLGSMAYARMDSGVWRPVAVAADPAVSSTGPATVLPSRQEDDLRAFCHLMSRRLPALRAGSFGSPELTWALNRFEMGCERSSPEDRLTDHLLALRALLEPEGAGSSRLPQRLALICARPEERGSVAERVAQALSLERAVITGLVDLGGAGTAELVEDIGEYLRALLRDVLCGHLDPDLVGVADRLVNEELASEELATAPA